MNDELENDLWIGIRIQVCVRDFVWEGYTDGTSVSSGSACKSDSSKG